MRKGKMVAQGCHASLSAYHSARILNPGAQWEWEHGLQTKVCLGVSSEQELQSIYDRAKSAGLPCSIITDAGKTEFSGVPTKTAVAIGPGEVSKIDEITGGLSLL